MTVRLLVAIAVASAGCAGDGRSTGRDADPSAGVADTEPQCVAQNETCGGNLGACCGSLVCRTRFNDRFESKSLCVERHEPGSVGGPCLPSGLCVPQYFACDRGLCAVVDPSEAHPGLVGGPCYDNGTCNPGSRCTDDGRCEAEDGCLPAQAPCSIETGGARCCTPLAACVTPDESDERLCCVQQSLGCEHSDDCCPGLQCWKWADGGSAICDVF